MIRDYELKDFEDIKRIHTNSGIPYVLPNLNAPLFIVTKVLEVEGTVRCALGAWVQTELYCWMDDSEWSDAEGKHLALQLLEKETMRDLYLKGIDHAVLWLPPNMERFGERLVDDFGFQKCQDGWVTYSKHTG